MATTQERSDLPDVGRLLALSDGVVAIALTLLVLQLTVPVLGDPTSASELWRYMTHTDGAFASYVISFYVIAAFWLAHHRVFQRARGHDEGLAWWNFAFLFFITVIPFTSRLVGEYGNNPLAVDAFAFNLLCVVITTQLVLVYGRRRDLMVVDLDDREVRLSQMRAALFTAVLVTR